MSLQVEDLFTQALGLTATWKVHKLELDQTRGRIDFFVAPTQTHLNCPICGCIEQGIHDRVDKQWRHLDFFQYEAWLHASVPRVHCKECGKTTQVQVPWARPGSGFTLLFEALSIALEQYMAVSQVAKQLRVRDDRLWRVLHHYVYKARALDDMSHVSEIGIDETSVKKGHNYITVVHDMSPDKRRLLFACEGKDHRTLEAFAQDLQLHGGKADNITQACMDMSGAYIKGAAQFLPQAQINFDRFHVIALANQAMDQVRREEVKSSPDDVRDALGGQSKKLLKALYWATRKNAPEWSRDQINVMHWLQRSNLKSARAWRLKTALQDIYAKAKETQDMQAALQDMRAWLSWASKSRLESFKKLAITIKAHLAGVLNGMFAHRTNAYVEAMNGLLQQAKRAARGFRTTRNFIAIAYLRLSKLQHLPVNPFEPAKPRYVSTIHRA
jgi:transposase